MRSWKTTLAGIAALMTVAAKIATAGQFDWATDGGAVIAAIGLLTAKDHDVSGR